MVGVPAPSPTAILMMSLVERSGEGEDDAVLVPPVLLPLVTPPPVPDGEPVAAVCVFVALPPPLVGRSDALVAVGAAFATGPTAMVEVAVGVPGSMDAKESGWLHVNMKVAMSPLMRAEHSFPKSA